MAVMRTKVTKPCPFCGEVNEIMRDINKNSTKHYYICNNISKHHNARVFYHERIAIADVIDDIDKMEVNKNVK